MIVLVILSWALLGFVMLGFGYLILSWILAIDAKYLFENNGEKWSLIFRRFLFMVLIFGGIFLIVMSLDSIPVR